MASQPISADEPIQIEFADEDGPTKTFNENGDTTAIEFPDGSITISLDGVLEHADKGKPTDWFDNLESEISDGELNRIANSLLRGIEDDLSSRSEWIENRAQGMRLLGLKIEMPGSMGGDGAPLEGMSKVRHPLLLEAVLRFQANARGEMLPTDGPVKIRNDNNNSTYKDDVTANALERDLNHYLTSTATEYYPDTDRMYLLLGFGGTAFKKVYYCPLRNRPVSESVDADDLIVNNDATDLANAKRVTHRIMMRPTVVKRMQILGVYRDIELGNPQERQADALLREKRDQEGISTSTTNPDDRDREIYECYCELDVKGLEHQHKGKDSGLEVPYRVTIDVSSKQILSIVRNYDEATKALPVAKRAFVKYTFVPGFGFYDIGLLNILGNTTNALTAAWREMLDNGMFANFPGFLMADTGGRQNTNIFRVPPGGGAQVKTNGMNIQQAVMPLPYNTAGMPALMNLTDSMAQTGMRIGGTSEAQVGEGRADAPVGTTLAMIDQATKMLSAVHKRMHSAQADEFRLLVECFQAHPESFWERNFAPSMPWDQATFLKALSDYDLSPQADPNTASHGQRVMKIVALMQLAQQNPTLYDPLAIHTAALQTIGWANPQQFFVPASAQAVPPPQLMEMMQKSQNETTTANAKKTIADAHLAKVQAEIEENKAKLQIESNKGPEGGGAGTDPTAGQAALISAHANMLNAQTKQSDQHLKTQNHHVEDQNRDQDRASKEQIALLGLAKTIMDHSHDEKMAMKLAKPAEKSQGE